MVAVMVTIQIESLLVEGSIDGHLTTVTRQAPLDSVDGPRLLASADDQFLFLDMIIEQITDLFFLDGLLRYLSK